MLIVNKCNHAMLLVQLGINSTRDVWKFATRTINPELYSPSHDYLYLVLLFWQTFPPPILYSSACALRLTAVFLRPISH